MTEQTLSPWIPVKQDVNDSLYWIGSVANPGFWADLPSFAVDLDPPWWHCKPCIDADVSKYRARLSIGTNFCPECGAQIEWPT